MSREELAIVWKLRRVLSGLESLQGLEMLLDRLRKTQSNAEFLMAITTIHQLDHSATGLDAACRPQRCHRAGTKAESLAVRIWCRSQTAAESLFGAGSRRKRRCVATRRP